ncbi:serpentine type 7TM GPCR chemoreceptor srt domain-containing protein [Ditylenchus destructor]|uniref:Serpentine type 7TM GPCR chemoreceptor srt domain-containing protein n=1 Tax=Ditylenchus destructor TaxID=166010 RepID=A0AAD4MNI0_9BILA|nr:serpentine type 7TM GPCR chemoreceptor srt domain-containing protein [Ditylenchus destructor]
MSLGDFIFHRDEFMVQYDCSRYNVNSIPIEERRNIPVGILFISLGILCETVYIPCVWAIMQQMKQKNCATCYIFMFYLGVVDSIGLLTTAIQCGILSIKGIVFCQWPIPAFCISNLGLFCWYAGNSTTLVLAINRCLVIYDNDLCDRLFKGRRGPPWLIIPTVAGLVGVWTTPPFMYNPMDSSALYNPHRHYLPDNEFFHSAVHITADYIFAIAIPVIYVIFGAFFARKLRASGMMAMRQNKKMTRELSTFLQVLLTSFFSFTTSLGFAYQQYLQAFPVINFTAFILYQGSPAFIYICMNQSIRNTLLGKTSKIYQITNRISSLHS